MSVVTRTAASAARALDLGAASADTDLASVGDVDGVVVATPSASHAGVIRSVLALDVPVFVEKPLTVNVADARELVAAAGGRIFVMDKWRYHSGVARLARLVDTAAIGEVFGLRTVRSNKGNPHEDADAIWHLLPHDLSIAVEIFGDVPVPASAVAHREGGIATGLFGHLRFGDGRWMAVEVSSNAPSHMRRIEVYGSEGVAVLADSSDEFVTVIRTSRSGAQSTTALAAAGELPLLAELTAFLGHLAGGPGPRSSAQEGLRVVESISGLRQLAGLDV